MHGLDTGLKNARIEVDKVLEAIGSGMGSQTR